MNSSVYYEYDARRKDLEINNTEINLDNYNFTWVKNEYLKSQEFGNISFHNCDSGFVPFPSDNLNIKYTHDTDYSKIPTLSHNLEHLVFNQGILSMKELHRTR